MYCNGQGVPRDYAAAVSWYRKAADQGDARAQFNLGAMYAKGQGVLRDSAVAILWFRKAADLGDANGQFNLGVMYYNGLGVPQSHVLAHMWFNLAAARFDASGKENRNKAVKNCDLVATKMTPAQLAEAQKLAREWKPKPER